MMKSIAKLYVAMTVTLVAILVTVPVLAGGVAAGTQWTREQCNKDRSRECDSCPPLRPSCSYPRKPKS